MLQATKLHIYDESHVVSTSTIAEIYKNIDPEYIYGFSGTPFRDDNSDLLIHGILGEQIIDVSASELINKGLLATPLIKFYTVPKMSVGSTYPAVYKDYIVENNIRNNMIADLAKELIDKKYTPLVLFKQIKHGDILLEKLQDRDIKCAMLYGNDTLERRNEVKEQLVNKEIDLILASTIFDLGLDLPILSALILCGGGKSSIRALQRIGRCIRSFPGKNYAAIVDFYDQVKFLKKHSMIRYKVYSYERGFRVFKSKEMK
jgi:superfamily II DNA or RNA helicase